MRNNIFLAFAIILTFGFTTVFTSCSKENRVEPSKHEYTGVPLVIFDTERGTVTLTPDAETIFTSSASGNCRYQLPGTAEWNAAMLEKIRRYNKMI